jgi:BirA family biotin operon repressor/biotin-[acetyl-CoA-carboxylase] ligase
MKGRILQILRTEGGIVSGEKLSSRTGISRVSVWKHMKKLQEMGYPIRATSKGYLLDGPSDMLYPWEFGDREPRIHYAAEAPSTMDLAREKARNGCPHLTVVIAGRQLRGRGRLKRIWLSEEGGLYFTMILRPRIPPMESFRLNLAAASMMAETLRSRFGIAAGVKWPNDILVGGKKICGILSELETEGDMVSFMNIGIGLNVNNDCTPEVPLSISIRHCLDREVSRKDLLESFLDLFESRIRADRLETLIDEWKRYAVTLNRGVRIETMRERIEGIARDVDEYGALLVEDAQGRIRRILCGDCFEV